MYQNPAVTNALSLHIIAEIMDGDGNATKLESAVLISANRKKVWAFSLLKGMDPRITGEHLYDPRKQHSWHDSLSQILNQDPLPDTFTYRGASAALRRQSGHSPRSSTMAFWMETAQGPSIDIDAVSSSGRHATRPQSSQTKCGWW